MKAAAPRTLYTAKEFFRLELPEHEKWELVKGELALAPSPILPHQLIANELARVMSNWLRTHPIALVVPDWDVQFLLNETRRPDILVALKEGSRLKLGDHGEGAPDFIIEILSPGITALITFDPTSVKVTVKPVKRLAPVIVTSLIIKVLVAKS